jgi:hypothetical protein
MNRIFSFFLFLFFLATMTPGWSVTPMEYYNSLVAGGSEAGFRDGGFSLARFNEPMGLAFDDNGNEIYVADSGNQRIRQIDLDHNDEVKTLAGTGSTGELDGPLLKATFNVPTLLTSLPGKRLAVFDSGNGLIRLIDLQNQNISTVAKGVTIRSMVYRAQDNSLYFSEPDSQKVEKMDMKSLVISTVFSNNAQVPNPGALCLFQDHLCVADSQLPTIYEANLDETQLSPAGSVSLSAVGSAKDVLALSTSDGFLYALQKGGFLVKVGLPESSVVNFPTPWGFLIKNQDYHGALSLLNISEDNPSGISASPNEARRFYISTEHSIVSVKDYDFEKLWQAFEDNGDHLTDFDYPAKKPARTFRILTIGTSRNSTAVPIPSDPNSDIDENIDTPRVYTFSKQLEFLLNTEAVLRNLNVHFEVLNVTHRGEAISTWAYYEVPDFVKKYDIDLVLALADQSGYKDYYQRPLTPEGIPAKTVDYEYLLQPLSERATGVALDLIQRCKKLKIPVSEKQAFPGDGFWSLFCNGDEQIQEDLREMTGRRLQLLHEKLNLMKTSGGNCPQLLLFYAPGGGLPNDCTSSFWNDVCAQYRLKFLDLSEPFNALKTSYSPVYADHFTTYGNELVSRLLEHYLIEDKIIPF